MAELPAAIRRSVKELARAAPPPPCDAGCGPGPECPAQLAGARLPWLLLDLHHILLHHSGGAGLGHAAHELEQVEAAAADWREGVAQAASLFEVAARHDGSRAALAAALACNGGMTALAVEVLGRCSRQAVRVVAADVWRVFAQRACTVEVQRRVQQLGDHEEDTCLAGERACWEARWRQRRLQLVQAVEEGVAALAAAVAVAELSGELDGLAEAHAHSIAACLQAAADCSGELGQQAAASAAALRGWREQADQRAGLAAGAALLRELVAAGGPCSFLPLALAKAVHRHCTEVAVEAPLHDEQESLLPRGQSPQPVHGRLAWPLPAALFLFRALTSDMHWPQLPAL